MAKTTVSVDITSSNALQTADKTKKLQAFANLSDDDQDRLNQIISKPKALNALKVQWGFLKAMFG